MKLRPPVLLLLAAATVSLGTTCGGPPAAPSADLSTYAVQVFPPASDLEDRLRTAAQFAEPGTIFELPAGTYQFTGDITFDTSHLVIRGQGMDRTVLDFSGQQVGSQGFLARGDHFTVQDFTLRDPAGNGIKTEFINGATYERVKVEWTGGPSSTNGAYGFYPSQSENVLIDGCIVIGARDAGIYVGQSKNIIVRNSQAMANVIGIEVENSVGADVHDNIATGNTLGVGIFNLPNLQIKNGRRTRLFDNVIADNNVPNFASGGLVASVPGGAGVIILANDEVEVYGNTISGHDTENMFVSSFFITLEPLNDPGYDPYAETVYIHDNVFGPGGGAPQGLLGNLVAGFMGIPVPDIGIGGFVDPAKIPGYDPGLMPRVVQVPDPLRICIRNNGAASFGSVNGFIRTGPAPDISQHDCVQPPLPPIVLPPVPAPPTTTGFTPEEIDALCNAPGTGVNWGAFVVNCPDLRSYRLFESDPRDPRPEGLHYDLTSHLFADYASKHRFIFLPPGTQMQYRDLGVFDFPVGTIILKTFSFESPQADPPRFVKVESRLLIHRADGWHGLPYPWNADETEALYTPQGARVAVSAVDDRGDPFQTQYGVPSRTDCGSCHFGPDGDGPIGPKAGLLNRPLPYSSANQLDVWAAEGVLAGSPGSAAAPRIPSWSDPGETVDERARAYLEANCAHCHNPAGRARFTGLWLDHGRPLGIQTGICKQPVAAGAASLGLRWDIHPGEAEDSILWARIRDTRPGILMPEIGRSVVHREGVELLRQWIDQLPGSCTASMMQP